MFVGIGCPGGGGDETRGEERAIDPNIRGSDRPQTKQHTPVLLRYSLFFCLSMKADTSAQVVPGVGGARPPAHMVWRFAFVGVLIP